MSRDPRLIILEFVGLPGAGKTTLTRLVAEHLAAEGYRCSAPRFGAAAPSPGRRGVVWRYARRIVSYFAHLGLIITTIRFGLAIRPLRLSRMRWLREIPDLVLSIRTAAAGHDLVLLDQAFIQAIWSATLKGSLPSAPLLEKLIRRATAACDGRVVYLHLSVDPETAMDRIALRAGGGSRFDRLPREEGAVLLAGNVERLGRIVDCATRATSAVVQELDGRATVRALGDTIIEFIATRLDLRESHLDPQAGGSPAPPAELILRGAAGGLGGTAIVSEPERLLAGENL
jgi:thymidylate kinase